MQVALRLTRSFLLLILVLIVAMSAFAQYNASIQGTVADASGAVIPGAKITATNTATGVSASTVSSGDGVYRIAGLPPGKYTVSAEAASFAKIVRQDVTVAAETTQGLNLTLKPGGGQESVTVTGEVPPMRTEDANIDGTISNAQIQNVPQYGRDPFDLVRMAPGVFGDGARSSNGSASVLPNTPGGGQGTGTSIFNTENQVQATANGQRLTSNSIMIDGTSVNDLTWAGEAIITPNQDSIQEMKVVSNSYSAEDGRVSGVQIKVISKYGTNQFHGSAFFKYNEPGLNAYNGWGGPDGQKPVRVPDKSRQFGGSIGGPIKKDKLFFFFSYEGNRLATNYTNTQYVETPQLASWVTANRSGTMIANAITGGAGSALAGNAPRIMQALAPTCADLNGQWPSYTGCAVVTASGVTGLDVGSPTGAYGQYVPTWTGDTTGGGMDGIPDLQKIVVLNPSTFHGNQYNARVDYTLGKNQFAVSAYYSPSNNIQSTTIRPDTDLTLQPRNKYLALIWNRVISSTMLNEFRFNATRLSANQYGSNSKVLWGLPRLEIEMLPTRIVWGPSASDNSPLMAAQNQFELRDNLSKIVGRHGLKMGMQVGLNQDNNNTMFGSQRPTFVFHGLWNYVNGAPIYEGINADPVTGAPTATTKYWRQTDWALYLQDDIKLASNFTLNLGLRYEYFGPLHEKYNRLSNMILGTGANPLQSATVKAGLSSLYPADHNNFSPRIGFAWSPSMFNNKTVVRGGFGFAYNRLGDNELGISRVNPPYVYRYGICCAASNADLVVNGWMQPPFANGSIAPGAMGNNYTSITNFTAIPALGNNIDPTTNLPINASAGIEIWGAPQTNRTPYTMLYSLDVQQQLPARFVMTVGYQGSQSRKLLRIVNESKVYPVTNAAVPNVYFPTTDVNGNYNAMNLTLNRPFANGLQLMTKYTWSKSMDQGTGEGAGQSRDPFYPANHIFDTGPSDFDATHNLLITAMWDLPIFRNRTDLLGRLLGGWHLDPQFQFHTGFPWSPVAYGPNCLQVPANNGNICPNLPTAYTGKGGTNYGNSTFKQEGGNFPLLFSNGVYDPNGWKNYFQLGGCPASAQDALGNCQPGLHRNAFRGPRYRQVNMTLGKTTRIAVGEREVALDLRANFFNLFNNLNLIPIQPFSNSTIITDPHFGRASGALAGRVVEFQTRVSF